MAKSPLVMSKAQRTGCGPVALLLLLGSGSLCLLALFAMAFALVHGSAQGNLTPRQQMRGRSSVSTVVGTPEARDKNTTMVNISVLSTAGERHFLVAVHRDWAPVGADRFLALVRDKYYDDQRFFRVIKNFIAQVGIHGDPAENQRRRGQSIRDDASKGHSNRRGAVTFAHAGANTRSTQIYFNLRNNAYLDSQGFTPFAEVVEGVDVLDELFSGYGEGGKGDGTDGKGPAQHQIQKAGNEYLDERFPQLSRLLTARVVNP